MSTELTVESQLSLQKVAGTVSPVSSSLHCVCVAHSLSFVAQVVQPVEKHTLGARFCHIMFLFGL